MRKRTRPAIVVLALLTAASAWSCKNEAQTAYSALEMDAFDTSVDYSEDFFNYANGGWLKANPIPATESSWSNFSVLVENNRKILKDILEKAAAKTDAKKGSVEQLIGDFYASGMDSAAIETAGITPLQAELDKISQVKDANSLAETLGYLHANGIYPLFNIYVDQDAKNSTQYALYTMQGGIGLPDRDYYFNEDDRSKNIRAEYLKHVANMFKLMGDDESTALAKANKVMEMETKLASSSMTRVERRDPHATYNKKTVAEIKALSPAFDWDKYTASAGVPSVETVIVSQPKFHEQIGTLVKEYKPADWQTYLQWHLVHSTAPKLSSAFVNEQFNFYGTTLSGIKELEPRWKRVLKATDGSIGEALGQEYVKVAFSPEAKETALKMVDNLKGALKEHILALEWMSQPTKEKALEKLGTIVTKIGYPDKWKDYSGLEINRESYVKNMMRADAFEFKRMMNKLGKPIDRTEWYMTPSTVNAYYNPVMNEIVFPAGILQPPFFDPKADDALNYGGIGAVIGHELTHGFDDEGRKFDADGNLKEWWTEEDAKKFEERAAVIEDQYSQYSPLDGVFLNGKLTLGENIADLGGLTIAHTAFMKTLEGKDKEAEIDGFTPEQRFFLGWARVWRYHMREEALRQMVLTNPHSPAMFRVNGPLSNMDDFHKAFALDEGDKMVRPASERARIW